MILNGLLICNPRIAKKRSKERQIFLLISRFKIGEQINFIRLPHRRAADTAKEQKH